MNLQFEEYICSLLSSIKYEDCTEKHEAGRESLIAPDVAATSAFGSDFIAELKMTRCFALWNKTTDNMVFDLFEHKHPCDGKTSTLEDVSLRLTSGIYDLHLDEHLARNLAPTREMLGNALNEGSRTAWKYANKWGSDLAKFRREQMAQMAARQQQQQNQSEVGEKTGTQAAPQEPHSPSRGIHHVSSGSSDSADASHAPAADGSAGFLTPAQQQAAQDFQRQAQAAAAQAGTQVRFALGSFGSFLSARQKAWSTGAAGGTSDPSHAPGTTPPSSDAPADGAASRNGQPPDSNAGTSS